MPGNSFLVPLDVSQHKISVTPEQFAKLPLDQRARILSGLQPSMKLRYMAVCEDMGDLVKAMEPQDVYLAVKEIGIGDAGDIITSMTTDQFRTCLDLDSWSRDELIVDSTIRWFTAMSDTPLEVLAEMIGELDYEFLAALFSGMFKVYISREDFDPDEGEPPDSFTPDGVYYLQFTCSEHERELLKKIMLTLCSERQESYARILSFVRDGMPITQSEEAYRWRTNRLSDLGFPEYNEALKLYSRPDKKKEAKAHSRTAGEPVPAFAIVRHDGHPALPSTILEGLSELEMAAVASSAAYLINKLLVADRSDPGDMENLVETMDKARGMISIGLDVLGGDPVKTICSVPLAEIFRTGYGRLLDLQERAQKLLDQHPLISGDRRAIRLEDHLRDTLAAILQPRPKFHVDKGDSAPDGNMDFRNVADVMAVTEVLDMIDASAEIFGRIFKIFKKDIAVMDIKGLNVISRDEINACRIANTAIARKILSGSYSFEPLPLSQIGEFYSKVFSTSGGLTVFSDAVKDVSASIAGEISAARPELNHAVKKVVDGCLKQVMEEMAGVDPSAGFDPDLISSLLIRK